MNDTIRAIVLGIIEGLTEFLPVSSTGHMLIAQPLLGVDPEQPVWRTFLFVSQLGAILAVVVYFWRDLWRRVLTKPTKDGWSRHILVKLAVAMLPTIAIALVFEDLVETHIENERNGPPATAIGLIIGAGLILWIDRRFRRSGEMTLEDVSLKQSFLIGMLQTISMWPGVSRSGATIMSGMALGLTPTVATEFSFYLAIPTMCAAAGWRLIKHYRDLNTDHLGIVLLGTAVAFVVALAVVAGFMQYVRSRRFTPFAIYRILLGVAVLVWFANRPA